MRGIFPSETDKCCCFSQQNFGLSWRRRSTGNVRFATRSRNNLTKNKKLGVSICLFLPDSRPADSLWTDRDLPLVLYQKRFKKERRFRRKLEQELQLSSGAHQRETGHGVAAERRATSPATDKEPVVAQSEQQQGQMGSGGGSTGRGSPEATSPDIEQERPCSTEATVD